jgi:hypothetical protein
MDANFKKIQHLSFQKKRKALSELNNNELKDYLKHFKIPFDEKEKSLVFPFMSINKKAKKTELIRLALRKT